MGFIKINCNVFILRIYCVYNGLYVYIFFLRPQNNFFKLFFDLGKNLISSFNFVNNTIHNTYKRAFIFYTRKALGKAIQKVLKIGFLLVRRCVVTD